VPDEAVPQVGRLPGEHVAAACALLVGEAQVPHEDGPDTYTRLRPSRRCGRSLLRIQPPIRQFHLARRSAALNRGGGVT
jgi:hypothetical protein